MSLQKYVAFLKTVELGSISLAAEQMGYTQSAVSRMILDLEKEWGMELLHLSRAGIALSSVGEHLLPAIRSIVADCEELKFAVNELHGLHTGLVRVGTFTSVANMWIPSLLVSFQKLYPGIEFTLMNSENYSEIEDWIQHGKVDCGFVNLPTVTDLQVSFLRRDTLIAVLPPEHPLAQSPVFPIARLQDEQRAFALPWQSGAAAQGALRGEQRPHDSFHGGMRAWHQRDALASCGYGPLQCGVEKI